MEEEEEEEEEEEGVKEEEKEEEEESRQLNMLHTSRKLHTAALPMSIPAKQACSCLFHSSACLLHPLNCPWSLLETMNAM